MLAASRSAEMSAAIAGDVELVNALFFAATSATYGMPMVVESIVT